MKKYFKQIKKGDLVIVVLLLLLSFLPLVIFTYFQTSDPGAEKQVSISYQGEEIATLELVADGEREEFIIENPDHGHYNKIVREGETVFIEEANCTDQLCVRMMPIENIGQTIICLPHQLVVQIESTSSSETEETPSVDIISYNFINKQRRKV
jgi:hypothetical protein